MSYVKKIFIVIIPIIFFFAGTGCNNPGKEYITLSELITLCELPGKCKVPLPYEGKEIKVRAFVDFKNVFDKEHYPQLPYEKFKIDDSEKKNSFEVWVTGDKSAEIFKLIHDNNIENPQMVFINAKMEGVDMPTSDDCRRWLKLILDSEENIFFGNALQKK